ncbi:MAG: hypothetical protein JRM74_01700 [Nitrososphaerota archaeon]|jgi:hypothetical protein|nr:hypothetical protein [Nitrososphaerota archaeon]MDG6938557.1 hypothetical protein [Nitrososphaerota archaeon]MDG6955896.1 hypothetical protein [Nitrososphaerota archaeon]MDG6957357.1 hypothetical protein [Nitrososphaerota archaeon]MDG6959298.1 hypothetical protein [Nitrososphaerota archaeon]
MSHPEFRARLTLEARVSPSEDPAKVAQALATIAGMGPEAVSIRGESARLANEDPKTLVHIRDQLRDRHVRSAARKLLLRDRAGHSASMMLNRQAAAAGVVAVCGSPEESPLGPVYLTITSEELDKVIDWLTAYTGG